MPTITKDLGLVVGLLSQATAPANTQILWFDTVNNQLKFYNFNTPVGWTAVAANNFGLVSMNNADAPDYLDNKIDDTTIIVNNNNKLQVTNPLTSAMVTRISGAANITVVLSLSATSPGVPCRDNITNQQAGDVCFVAADTKDQQTAYFWSGLVQAPYNSWIKFYDADIVTEYAGLKAGYLLFNDVDLTDAVGQQAMIGAGGLSAQPALVSGIATGNVAEIESTLIPGQQVMVAPDGLGLVSKPALVTGYAAGDVPVIGTPFVPSSGAYVVIDSNGKLAPNTSVQKAYNTLEYITYWQKVFTTIGTTNTGIDHTTAGNIPTVGPVKISTLGPNNCDYCTVDFSPEQTDSQEKPYNVPVNATGVLLRVNVDNGTNPVGEVFRIGFCSGANNMSYTHMEWKDMSYAVAGTNDIFDYQFTVFVPIVAENMSVRLTAMGLSTSTLVSLSVIGYYL
jgi:hypothetical protein